MKCPSLSKSLYPPLLCLVAVIPYACTKAHVNPPPTQTANPIVGTWHIRTAVDYGGNTPYTAPLTACDTTANYIFSTNGAFNVTRTTTTGCWFGAPPVTAGTYTYAVVATPLSFNDDQGNVVLSSTQVLKASDGSGNSFFPVGPIVFTNSTKTTCTYASNGIVLTLSKQ